MTTVPREFESTGEKYTGRLRNTHKQQITTVASRRAQRKRQRQAKSKGRR